MKNFKVLLIAIISLTIANCASSDNELKEDSKLEAANEKPVKDVTGEADELEEKSDQVEFSDKEYQEETANEKANKPLEEEGGDTRLVKLKDKEPYLPDFEEAVKMARKNRPEVKAKDKPKQLNMDQKETKDQADKKDFSFGDIDDIEPKDEKKVSFLAAIIYHSNGRADLSSKDINALKKIKKYHKEKKGIVKIIGHASSRTRDMKLVNHKVANFKMSYKRAEIIAKKLKSLGVPQEKIYIGAVADQEPVKSESMPIYEAMNRRTEIYIAY